MLSYRHGFHAGNFADVLKHTTLCYVLSYLLKKDKPFRYIDSHAGAGRYALASGFAQKNREYENGIGRLWGHSELPPLVADYVDLVRRLNENGQLRHYPGSPAIAGLMLRPEDRLFLYELHNNEFELLRGNFRGDRRARLIHGNGLEGVIASVPPKERRGLVLFDPSYEIKSDYHDVVDTLRKAHRRFETGMYAIWYPVVERRRVQEMERAIKASGIKRVQLFELGIRPDSAPGMGASGMILVNPPWDLMAKMRDTLPWLAKTLGEQGQGHYRVEELAGE